ncbi:tubulin-like doman-containing protein [Bacillus altitudinis]|uniref:tubulin-like doman-containing protein n=1 Tax=Bacillus altitudinis TaxID=293387 RepID=UPI0024A86601|nr:tubulin-like doman-containing protein [Bacillus altitudinis]WHF25340.1 tubulin-like doman-containing protein [Bacillus altitudinis]
MYGFVGIGQCGGSIADEAMKRGYFSIAVNYSSSDLNSLEVVEDKLKLVGSEGVGKDREAAINYFKNNWESSIEFIKEAMEKPSIQIVFVVFSTAGGTGSGIAPTLIELLDEYMDNKTVVAVPVLPDTSEVVLNQLNTIECLQELSEKQLNIIPLDNLKVSQKAIKTFSEPILYQKVNKQFIDMLEEVEGYTNLTSSYSTLDKKDLNQIFDTPGVTVISKMDLSEYNKGKFANTLHDDIKQSWKHSIYSADTFDSLVKTGLIIDGNANLTGQISFKRLFSEGEPLDLFRGYYDTGKNQVISILSGLRWINDRMKQLDDLIESRKVEPVKEDVYVPKFNSKSAFLRQQTNSIKDTKQVSKGSYLDKLKSLKG